jgi:hypothetical protein
MQFERKVRVRGRKFWISGAGVLFVVLLGAVALWRPSKPTAEVEFVPVEAIFKDPNALGRVVLKLRSFLPQARAYTMMEMIASERLGSDGFAKLIRKEPGATSDGIRVWLVNDDELKTLAGPPGLRRNELVAQPRIMTHEGMMGAFSMQSSIAAGGTNYTAGKEVRVIAHRAGEKTDLLLGFRDTDLANAPGAVANIVVKTNVHFAVRVQLPPQTRAIIEVDHEKGKAPLLISVQTRFQKP